LSRQLSTAITTEIAKATAKPRTLYYLEMLDKATGATNVLRLTNHDTDISFQGNTFSSYRVKHSNIKTYLKNQVDNCSVTIDNVDKAMSAFLGSNEVSGQKAEIYKVFLDASNLVIDGFPTTDDKILQFTGFMDRPQVSEKTVSVRIVNAFDRSQSYTPWRRFTAKCNWRFCKTECTYNSAAGAPRGTVDGGSAGSSLTDSALVGVSTMIGATCKMLTGANKNADRRVSGHNTTTGQIVFENSFSSTISAGDTYLIECDKSKSTCIGFGNEANFGGCYIAPYVSTGGIPSGTFVGIKTMAFPTEGTIFYPRTGFDGQATPVVYGETKITGVLLEGSGTSTDTTPVHSGIIGLCEGEIQGITPYYSDNTVIPGSQFNLYYGTATQEFTRFTTTYYYHYTAVVSYDVVQNNEEHGPITDNYYIIKGLKLQEYDSSGNPTTYQWSQNPAWAILDFLLKRASRPLEASQINFATFLNAAQICDTNNYKLNLAISEQKKDTEILDLMLTACRGYLTYSSGKVEMNIEQKWSGPAAHTFDDASSGMTGDNIKQSSFSYSKKDVNDRPNRIVVRYTDVEVREHIALIDGFLDKSATTIPYGDLQGEFPASGTVYIGIESVTYTDNDGSNLTGCATRTNDYSSGYPIFAGTQTYPEMTAIYNDYDSQDRIKRNIEKELDGKAIPTYRQAYNIAEWVARKSIDGNTQTDFTGLMDSLHLTVGDVVEITHDLPGWTSEEFRVIEASESEDEEVAYVCEVYDDAFYEENDSTPGTVLSTSLPNPFAAPGVATNLLLLEDGYFNTDGTEYIATLTLTYDLPADYLYWGYGKIQVRADGETNFRDYGQDRTAGNGYTINAIDGKLKIGQTIYVRVISVSTHNVFADEASAPVVSITIQGPGVPKAVTGLQLEGASDPTNYVWNGLKFAIEWRGASQTGGAGTEPAGQELQGAGGVGVDPTWLYDEVAIWTDGVLRHTIYTKGLRYEYIYGDGYDDFLDGNIVTSKGTVTIKVRRWNKTNKVSPYTEITITQAPPAAPAGLVATPFFRSVRFRWFRNNETDISHYSSRTSINGGVSWSAWAKTQDVTFSREVTLAELNGASSLTVDFEVFTTDIYGNDSGVSSISATTEQVLPSDLYTSLRADFVIRNSIFYFGDDGSNPTPGTETTLYWTVGIITRDGTDYALGSGALANAENSYIIATLSGGTATLSKTVMTSVPVLSANQVVIAYTSETPNGVGNYIAYIRQANSVQIEGASIRDLTVQDAHIQSLGADKIQADTILSDSLFIGASGDQLSKLVGIEDNATANLVDAILLNRANHTGTQGVASLDTTIISGGKIITDLLSADNIQTGTLTGRTIQTAVSGKRFVVDSASNEARFYGDRGDGTVEELATIGINAVGTDNVVIKVGGPNCERMGVYAETSGFGAWFPALHGKNEYAIGVGVRGSGGWADFWASLSGAISFINRTTDPGGAGSDGRLYIKNNKLTYLGPTPDSIGVQVLTGAPTVMSEGSQSINALTNWLIPKGVYQFACSYPIILQLFIAGAWRSTVDEKVNGVVFADGVNMRLRNDSGSGTTIHYQMF